MIERIGFIGLGIMGLPMCHNLLKAGFHVTAYNRTWHKTEEIQRNGARVVTSPEEVTSNADVVITMVTDTPDVQEVILGEHGVIKSLAADTVVIDMSTISPKVTIDIATTIEAHGGHMLDAPVSGGSWGAAQGTLAIMVGGKSEIFERCTPVFHALGKRIVHVGPNGSGQWVKLVNQILVAGTLNAVCEALVFASSAKLDLSKTIEAVGSGAAGSWQLENLGKRILDGDFAPGFMVKLQQKDLRLVLEQARAAHIPLPGTSLVHQLFQSNESAGEESEGTQALVKVLERLAGVQARTPDGLEKP